MPETAEKIGRIGKNLRVASWLQNAPFAQASLAERMKFYEVPGVSIAVIKDGQVDGVLCVGVREAGRPEPITPETLFQAGSISKPVAAVAALRLVQEGRLDLDEDVNAYLTSWKVPKHGDWQPRVTLRQLLSHSAGTTVHGFPGYPHDNPIPTLVQVLDGQPPANTPPIRVNTIPGTQMRYSGGGTSIVQQILIDVLGKPFPQIMRELVLDPLGMKNSSYEQPLPESRAQFAATGHFHGYKPVATKSHVYPEMAAAGLWTTPSDLALYAIEMQAAWAGRSEKVLSQDIVKEMLTPQMEDVGLGPFLAGKGETRRFGHNGADAGFHASLVAYVEKGFGAIIMKNAETNWGLLTEIERAIASEYDWPDFLPKTKVPTPLETTALASYAGKYELTPRFSFLVTQEGGGLFVQPTGQPGFALLPESETNFFANVVNATITFVKAENGEISGLTFRQNEKEMQAKRV